MKKIHALCLASLAALGSSQVMAQNAGQFYGGLGVGEAQSKIDDARISESMIGSSPTSISHEERDTAYKVFGGYQFNPYLAMEAGYFNLGEFGFKSTGANTADTLSGRIKLDGYNLDLVGTLPVNDQLSLLGRVGAHNARARDTFIGTGAVTVLNRSPEIRETNYKAGVGFSYKLSQSMTLRGELERYRINDAVGNKGDINVASLTMLFPFGRTPAPAPKAPERTVYQDTSVVVVTPPAEAPVVAVAPVPERLRVSFNADVMFGFDRATVTPAGKRALDKFSNELTGVEYDHVSIEGHTDRIGAQAYNEKLSLQRAEAVKTYLVSRGAIQSNKIVTLGKGSTEPVTDVGACKGVHTSAAVIACLEPDRRVDLDVVGSQPAKK